MPRSQVDRGTLKNDDHEMSLVSISTIVETWPLSSGIEDTNAVPRLDCSSAPDLRVSSRSRFPAGCDATISTDASVRNEAGLSLAIAASISSVLLSAWPNRQGRIRLIHLGSGAPGTCTALTSAISRLGMAVRRSASTKMSQICPMLTWLSRYDTFKILLQVSLRTLTSINQPTAYHPQPSDRVDRASRAVVVQHHNTTT
jgi:hypothetical protein